MNKEKTLNFRFGIPRDKKNTKQLPEYTIKIQKLQLLSTMSIAGNHLMS